MEIFTGIVPLVRGVTKQFFIDFDRREDLLQEGLLKLHCYFKKEPPPVDALKNEFFIKKLKFIAKNAMIDYVRRSVKSTRYFLNYSSCDPDKIIKYHDQSLNNNAIDRALKELRNFIPDIENKILKELVQPSDEYCVFLRRKTAVQNINTKILGKKFKVHTDETKSLADFLRIPEHRLRRSIDRIKKVVLEKKSEIF